MDYPEFMAAGIKRIRVDVEVDEQMSAAMIAIVLRELAHKIELGGYTYARDLTIFWTPESLALESE